MNAGKVVNEAILGMDYRTVVVNGKAYTIQPPTIKRISGAALCLTPLSDEAQSIGDIIRSMGNQVKAAEALSWFICGDGSMREVLLGGTYDEIVEALEVAYSLISVENFIKLSGLAGNIVSLTAKQRL